MPAWANTPFWCFAIKSYRMRSNCGSPYISARSKKPAAAPPVIFTSVPIGKYANLAPASKTSRISTPPASHCRPTAGLTCSSSRINCGTPTALSTRFRRLIRCCRAAPLPPGAATPNSPTCARPTTRSTNACKQEIEDLVCLHSNMYSRGKLGLTEFTDEERIVFKPVRQRLVRRHPVTGRKSLFLSAHAGEIEGMSIPQRGCCCSTSPSSRRGKSSSIRMSGGSTTS